MLIRKLQSLTLLMIKRFYHLLVLVSIFVCVFQQKAYSQACATCTGVTTFTANLSASPINTYTVNSTRNGVCCQGSGSDRCVRFEVTVHPLATQIQFLVSTGNNGTWQINCTGTVYTPASQPCLGGLTTFCITYCNPGAAADTYTITTSSGFGAGADLNLRAGCSSKLTVGGLTESTITWNSVVPGTSGQYNSFLSCLSACDTTTVTPTTGAPTFIDYRVCGTAAGCSSGTYCDTQRVYISPALTVAITPATPVLCSGGSGSLTLTATPTGGASPYTYAWNTGPTTNTVSVNSAGTYTVSVNDQASGCGAVTQTVSVASVTTPTATATPSSEAICSGSATNIALSSTASGTTYSWTVSQSGVSGATAGSGSTIAQTLTATGTSSGTATYTITPVANGCTGANIVVTVTVEPTPVATATPSSQTICSGNATSIALTSNVAGSTFLWSVGQTNVTGASGSSGTTIAQTLTATSTVAGTATYTITPFANSCLGAAITATVTVNPAPVMTSANTGTICSGGTVSIPLTANVASSFTWIATNNANTSGESTTSQSTSTLSNTITNSTTSAQAVVYTVTPTSTSGSCPGTAQTVTVTVNPTPAMTSASTATICSGGTASIALTANVASSFTWIAADNANTTGESTTSQNTSTLSNTITNTSTSVQTVVYTVTPTSSAGTCAGTAQTVTVTVNPTPAMTSASSATICGGATVSIPLTANVASSFTWIAANNANTTGESTTLQSTSTLSNTITNSTTAAENVIYTVTPTSTGGACPGVAQTVTVTVNPIPTMTSSNATTICSGATVSIPLTANVASTFTWIATDNANTTGESTASQSTSTLSNTITNSTTSLQTVIYTVTPTSSAGSCPGTAQTVTVSVNPTPAMTSASTATICSGGSVSIALTANVASTFTWIAANNANTTGESTTSQTTSTLSNTITNTSTSVETVIYTVTPTSSSGTCAGIAQTVTVTVNPTPAMTSANTATICSGGTVSISLTSNVASSFTWIAANNANTTGESTTLQSTGTLSNTITNSTSSAQSVIYTVTPTSTGGSCPGTSQSVTVTVNPAPSMTSSSATTICSGGTVSIPLTANIASSFTWIAADNANTTGESTGLQTTSTLSNTITNSTTSLQTVIYTVTPTSTAGSCAGAAQTVTVSVNPTPAMTSASTATICSGGTVSIALTANVASTFTWIASDNANTSGESTTSQSTATLSNTITNSTASAQAVVYTVTPTSSAGTCAGIAQTVTVTVEPLPVMTSANTASICGGNTVSIALTANIASSFTWIAADNANTTGESITSQSTNTLSNTITNSTAAAQSVIYTVTPTSTAGSCVGTAQTVTVTVNPAPSMTSVSTATICSGASVSIALTSNIASTFTWIAGDNANTSGESTTSQSTSTLSNTITSTSTSAQNVTYTVIPTSTGGSCPGTAQTVTVTVNPTPAMTSANTASICSGSAVSIPLTSNVTSSFTWIAANNASTSGESTTLQSSSTLSNTITNSTAVAQNVIYTVTPTSTGGNCAGTAQTVTVTVNPIPVAPGASSNSPVCLNGTLNLSTSLVTGATYSWTGPGGFTSALQSPSVGSITSANAGTYTVNVTVAGCTSPNSTVAVTINPPPTTPVLTSNSPVCTGQSITLTSSTITAATYSWTGPNGFTSTSQNPTLTNVLLAAGGTYSVVATVPGCGSSATATVAVTVNSTPSAPTAGSNSSICVGSTLNLTSTTVGGATYSWTGPSGFTSPLEDPSISNATTAASGTYSVTVTVSGCTSVAGTVAVSVNPIPLAPNAGSNSPVCENTTLSLTASTITGATYNWSGPNSYTITSQNPSITNVSTAASGTYTVTATVAGCTSPTATVAVTVNTIPASPGASAITICQGTSDTLFATAPGGSYEWYSAASGGTLLGSGASFVTPTLTATTTYFVQTTVNGCTSPRTSVTVTTSAVPAAPTVAGTTICEGLTATLNATAPGGSYEWYDAVSGGNNVNSGASYTTPVLSASTTYFVNTTIAGCTGPMASVTVTVTPTDDPSFSYATGTYCATGTNPTPTITGGFTGTFSASPAGLSFVSTSTGQISLSGSALNTYSITFTTNGPCPSSSSMNITVTNAPSAAFNYTGPYCQSDVNPAPTFSVGASAGIFSASPAGLTFTSTSTGEVDLTVTTPGTYTVTNNIVAAGGCAAATSTNTITINPMPTVSAGVDQTICEGSTVTLAGVVGGSASSGTWNGGAGSFSSNTNLAAVYTPSATETSVELVLTTNDPSGPCASVTDTMTITINPIPVAPTAAGETICAGTTATLNATAPGGTYEWYDAASGGSLLGSGSTFTSPTLTTTTTYFLQTTVLSCPSPRSAVTVTVNPIPAAPTAPGITICTGSAGSLTATAPGGTYDWYDAASGGTLLATNSSFTTPTLTATTTYYVESTISGCTGPRAAVVVTVNPFPVAPTASGITVCSGSTGIISATAPGGTYQWYNAASGGSLLGTGSTFTTPSLTVNTTFFVQTTVGGCTGPMTSVTATVNPIPTAPVATGTVICAGTNTTLNATAPGPVYRWYNLPSGGSLLATGAAFTTPTLTTSTTYYVQTTTGGCTSPRTPVTVTVTPLPAAPTAASATVCTGSTATLTATAPGGTYEWYDAASNGNLLVTNASYTTPALSISTTYYVQTTVSGCAGPRSAITVSVTPTDDPSFNYSSGTYCFSGANPLATITGGFAGTFSSLPAGLAFVSTSTGEINAGASSLNTYTVTFTTNGPCPSSSSTSVTITNAFDASFSFAGPYCQASSNPVPSFNVGASAGTFSGSPAGLNFVNASTGEIDLTTSAAGTYTVTNNIAASGGCAAASATATVTVNPRAVSNAGTDKNICVGSSVTLTGSLSGSATNGTWSGGTGSFSNANNVNTVYTPGAGETSALLVLTTNDPAGPCPSGADTVLVTINPIPVAPTASGATICEGTSTNLTATAPGGTYTWYDAASGGSLLATGSVFTTPTLTTATTFYVQTSVSGCSGPRTAVTVNITPTDDPSFAYGSGTYCATGSNPTPGITGGSGGTFSASPAGLIFINTSTGEINLAATPLNTYQVSFATNGTCPDTSTMNVTVTNAPDATFSYSSPFCEAGSNPSPSFGAGASAGAFTASPAGLVFVNPSTGEINLATSTPATYTITNDIAAAGGCAAATATATVTINPRATVNAGADQTVCVGTPITLSGIIGGSAVAGTWSGGAGSFSNTTDLNAVYTAGAGESSATLTLTTDDPSGPCAAVSDVIVLTFDKDTSSFAYASGTFCASGSNPVPVINGGYNGTFTSSPAGLVFVSAATGEINLAFSGLNTYTVTFTTNGTCPNSTSVNVTVTTAPDATFTYAGPYCQSEANPVPTFNPGSSAGVFTASPLGLNFINPATGEVDMATSTAGTYTVTNDIVASGGCAAANSTNTITIDPAAIVSAGSNQLSCEGSTVTLNGSISGAASSATWSGGLGSFSNNTNLNAVYTPAAGETSVTLILTSDDPAGPCGSDADTMTININPVPVSPTANGITICSGTSDTLSATAPGGSYEWYDAASGGTLLVTGADFTTPALTITTVYYVETTVGGCTSPRTAVTVTVTPGPVINAGADQSACSNNAVISLSGTVSGSSGGMWSTNGTGTFAPDDTTLVTGYTASAADVIAGSVTFILTSTGNGNCSAVTDTIVTVFTPAPSVNAGADLFVCKGDNTASLNGSVTGPTSTGQWSTLGSGTFTPDDLTLGGVYNLSTADTTAGTVMLVLSSTNNGNCNTVTDTLLITMSTPAFALAGNDTSICASVSSLTLSGLVSGGSIQGVWTTSGDGAFTPDSSALNAAYIPGVADTANGLVVLTLTPVNSCQNNADSFVVTITPAPVVNAGSNQFICIGTNTVAINGAVSGGSSTGTWSTTGSGTFNPDVTTLNGTYNLSSGDTTAGSVTLILTSTNNGNCSAVSDSMVVTLTAPAFAFAGNDTNICASAGPLTLSGLVSGGSVQGVWSSSGDGVFTPDSSALNAGYIPGANDISTGSVVLTLTPVNSCQNNPDSVTLAITPAPVVNAGSTILACTGTNSVILSGSVSGGTTTGSWTTNGTGTFSPDALTMNATYNLSAADSAAGGVTLVLTSSNNGSCGPVSDSVAIVITTAAIPMAGNDTTICDGDSMIVLNGAMNGGNGQGVWTSLGGGTFSSSDSVLNAIYIPDSADYSNGFVTFVLSPQVSCNSATDTVVITINASPVLNAGTDQAICSSSAVITLSATAANITGNVTWTVNGTGLFSPSDTSLASNYTPDVTDPATLVFTLSGTNGACSSSDSIVVVRGVAPVAAFTGGNLNCSGQAIAFADSSSGGVTSWMWSFGNGDTSSVQNPSYTYSVSGTQSVTLVVSAGPGCSDTLTQTVFVNSAPLAAFTSIANCTSDTVQFIDNSTVTPGNIISWSWNFGDGNNSSTQNTGNLYDSSGVYNVALTVVSDSGCSATITQAVSLNASPNAGFTSVTNCSSSSATFTDTSTISGGTISSWSWSFGDGNTSITQNPSNTYSVTGTYTVSLVVASANGCMDSSTAIVTVGLPVVADYIPAGGTYNVNQSIQFTNQSGGASTYAWDFGNTATSTATDPANAYSTAGTYTVMLIASNGSCVDSIAYVFTISETGYTIPSGFTPNGDGLNDFFYVRGGPFSEYELRVFNEWGNQVFISNDQNTKWDGTFKSSDQPGGTYIYIFNGKTSSGEELKLNGEINLIR
jgi:gliding motility-associated-like protein